MWSVLSLVSTAWASLPSPAGVVLPDMDEALVYLMQVDNRGPASAELTIAGWAATQRVFPNAQLVASDSMDDFVAAVLRRNEQRTNSYEMPTITNKVRVN